MRIDWTAKFRADSSNHAVFGVAEEIGHITEAHSGGVGVHGDTNSPEFGFYLWTLAPIVISVVAYVRSGG